MRKETTHETCHGRKMGGVYTVGQIGCASDDRARELVSFRCGIVMNGLYQISSHKGYEIAM